MLLHTFIDSFIDSCIESQLHSHPACTLHFFAHTPSYAHNFVTHSMHLLESFLLVAEHNATAQTIL